MALVGESELKKQTQKLKQFTSRESLAPEAMISAVWRNEMQYPPNGNLSLDALEGFPSLVRVTPVGLHITIEI